MKLFLILMMLSQGVKTNGQEQATQLSWGENKQIPASVKTNVLKALSFFPELKATPIRFVLKPKIRNSFMQAQPVFSTLLKRRSKRVYQINISSSFKLILSTMPLEQIPDEVMIGWIGHELGHILDYEGKSNADLVSFGYRYLFQSSFVKHAEMLADSYAVERGMGNYIVATKRYILDHAELPQAYKDKISRLYLSPDVILELVQKLEEKKLEQQTADQQK